MYRPALWTITLIFVVSSPLVGGETSPATDLPSGYSLVFAEDFTQPTSMENFVFASAAHWKRVRAGNRWALEHSHAGAQGYAPPHRSPHNIALVATHRLGSFVLECELQQTGREYGHRDACIFFGFVDPAHFYYTHIATKADPHAHQIFTVNDAARTAITRVGTSGFDWGPADKWHSVRLVRDVDRGTIKVYIDDLSKPILEANDRTHEFGYAGVGSFDDTGRVTNIRIYAAQAEKQRAPFFDKKPN